MVNPGLKNKAVLVTGSNNPYGIGAGIARVFAAQGAKIILHYFRMKEGSLSINKTQDKNADSFGEDFYRRQCSKDAHEMIKAIHDIGGEVYAWEADLSVPSKISELFDQAEKNVGSVDILVNNAAHWEADTFIPKSEELKNELVELWTDRPNVMDEGIFDEIFAVNTRAAALTMKEFAQRHIKRGAKWGRIINISKDGAYCFPSEVSYGASKFALESYTRSAAAELGQFGITVNTLALGPVQTGWITPELEKQLLPSIPLGRVGVPEDVANAVIFLASDQAGWITGQKIFIGGGHEM